MECHDLAKHHVLHQEALIPQKPRQQKNQTLIYEQKTFNQTYFLIDFVPVLAPFLDGAGEPHPVQRGERHRAHRNGNRGGFIGQPHQFDV